MQRMTNHTNITVGDVGNALSEYKPGIFRRTFGAWQPSMAQLYNLYHYTLLKNGNDMRRHLNTEEAFALMKILVTNLVQQGSASSHAMTDLERHCETLLDLCRALNLYNAFTEENFRAIYSRLEYASNIHDNIKYLSQYKIAKPCYIAVLCAHTTSTDCGIPHILTQFEGYEYPENDIIKKFKEYLLKTQQKSDNAAKLDHPASSSYSFS